VALETFKVRPMLPLGVSAHDYRLFLQLRVKRLLHRNEEGIQINMEDTASHETIYKLAHKADKANPWSDCNPIFSRIVIPPLVG
jgi:hypothetical protein